MSQPLDAIYDIPRASAAVGVRFGLLLFVRGPLRPHGDLLSQLIECARLTSAGKKFAYYRLLGDKLWRQLPATQGFLRSLGYPSDGEGNWGIELSDTTDDLDNDQSVSLAITDVLPYAEVERASSIHFTFHDGTAYSEVASFAHWIMNNFPIWWGSAGFYFRHMDGSSDVAYMQIAAMAKRFLGVQIQDLTALQWDALQGMPSVNWLTLVGLDFAAENNFDLSEIALARATLSGQVFYRQGKFGVVFAAGRSPTMGDVNVGEDVSSYNQVARALGTLISTSQTPLDGPFAKAEVLSAWLMRFTDPDEWAECDISD